MERPTHFRPIGKLRQLNPDGTQVVELMKPPHGPYGFCIARGNAKYGRGMCDKCMAFLSFDTNAHSKMAQFCGGVWCVCS